MDDLYCYKDSNVLINMYDLHDKKELDELEGESVNTRIISLELRPDQITSELSINHLQELHKYLFGNIYEWAGQFRKVDITKSERVLSGALVEYSTYKTIEKALTDFLSQANDFKWNTKECMIQSTSKLLIGIWEIHPFREGNTRTCTTFVKRILNSKGIEFNAKLLKDNPAYVRDSLVLATYDEPKYLSRILTDSFNTSNNNLMFINIDTKEEYEVAKESYYSLKEAKGLIKKKHKLKDNSSK